MNKQLATTLLALAAALPPSTALAQEHHHHHQFAADIDAFHAVLAPVWHANPGKARSQNACAKAGKMETLAADIRSTDASALRTSIATLKGKCKSKQADVDGALHDVHEEFHRLIEPK
jgi:hypothetical protein